MEKKVIQIAVASSPLRQGGVSAEIYILRDDGKIFRKIDGETIWKEVETPNDQNVLESKQLP